MDDIAKFLLHRLQQLHVQFFVDDSGVLRSWVPSAGYFDRPVPLTDYALGHEDGAIRELRLLLKSCPALQASLKRLIQCGSTDRPPQTASDTRPLSAASVNNRAA